MAIDITKLSCSDEMKLYLTDLQIMGADDKALLEAYMQANKIGNQSKLLELSVLDKKMNSNLYSAKLMAEDFTDEDYKKASKFQDLESKFEEKRTEIEVTANYGKAMANRLSNR